MYFVSYIDTAYPTYCMQFSETFAIPTPLQLPLKVAGLFGGHGSPTMFYCKLHCASHSSDSECRITGWLMRTRCDLSNLQLGMSMYFSLYGNDQSIYATTCNNSFVDVTLYSRLVSIKQFQIELTVIILALSGIQYTIWVCHGLWVVAWWAGQRLITQN